MPRYGACCGACTYLVLLKHCLRKRPRAHQMRECLSCEGSSSHVAGAPSEHGTPRLAGVIRMGCASFFSSGFGASVHSGCSCAQVHGHGGSPARTAQIRETMGEGGRGVHAAATTLGLRSALRKLKKHKLPAVTEEHEVHTHTHTHTHTEAKSACCDKRRCCMPMWLCFAEDLTSAQMTNV